jgi:4-amino-4-deoxy-L-arabinose transferase-like glycosyltransferase
MSRVAHWISNNNVSFYPTAIIRQLYQMPLAEFAILHVQVLTGGDLYANLIQWISFFSIICFGFLLASELELNRRQQFLSAVITATLPMAILQASSTQNDLVVSSFLMSFALFMLRLRDKLSAESLLLAAISLGLALLTKGTAYIYASAVGMSLSVPVLMARKHDHQCFLKAAAALSFVVIFALLLNVGHF